MKKLIMIFLCLSFAYSVSAQNPVEDFKRDLTSLFSISDKEKKEYERIITEQYGISVKYDLRYSRLFNQIAFTFEFYTEDIYNLLTLGDTLEDTVKGSIEGLLNGYNKEDPSGMMVRWFLDGMQKANTSIVYYFKCGDKQIERKVSALELRQYATSLSIKGTE